MLQKFKQSSPGYTEVYAWGDDEFGQLGVSGKKNNKNYSSPRCCSFNIVIHQISCGDQHSAFIASNGYIYCMGNNEEGRLGLSQRDIKYSYSPCLVESLSRYRALKVMCGWGHTIALVESGEVFTWGYGADGQLGNNNPNSQYTPQLVDFAHLIDSLKTTKVRDIACGGKHSFTIMENNKVCCFGCAETGQLGTGSSNNEIIPCVLDTIYEDILEIACGHYHTLFLTESRKVYSTGGNSYGELGVGNKKTSFLPIKLMMLDSFQIEKISASNHSAALTDKGELYLWGPFSFGESVFPQKIIIKNRIKNVSLGSKFGICIDSVGSLYGWGDNENGELGLGDYDQRNNINQIITLQNKTIKDFSCGGNFVIALGNTINKKIEEPNENNTTKTRLHLNLPLVNEAFPKNNNNANSYNGGDYERKAKSHHIKANNSIGDFREDTLLNFKNKNNQVKYLTNEEIKNRQKASLYESPNRITDREFEYVPGTNCESLRTSSPLQNEINMNKAYPSSSFQKGNDLKSYKAKSNNNSSAYQVNILKEDPDLVSNSKNQLGNNNFRKEKPNDFNILSKDVIMSRQGKLSTNKDYGSTTKEYGFESSVVSKNTNVDANEYLVRSKEKEENPKTEKTSKNGLTEIQQQQYELYQNNKREIDSLKNDQLSLQEKYYRLEQNFFEIEQNLKTEKAKNTELQRLYDDQRSQNKTYMKELNEREQILEKIEFLNQVLQEKEQELMLARGEIPKQEKFYEDNFKNMKMKHENQIKSLENDLDSYSQQIERLTYEIQNGNDENNKKNDIIQSLMDEKNDLLIKIENLENMVKKDQSKIKKMGQEINGFSVLEEENGQLKNLLEEKDNEISLLNKNLYDLTEKIEYNENKKDRELRKYEETERELGTIQEKIIYLEKLLTQKDSEIEQLKQIVEDSNQRVKRSTIPNEKPSILEKRIYDNLSQNYTNEINYASLDSLQKKDRSITPNPSTKKAEINPLVENNTRGSNEFNKMVNVERNYKKEIYQESKMETKERAVVFNSNLHEIKAKLSDLQKNKNALEKRMQDFEQRLKDSKNNK